MEEDFKANKEKKIYFEHESDLDDVDDDFQVYIDDEKPHDSDFVSSEESFRGDSSEEIQSEEELIDEEELRKEIRRTKSKD